jgi:hypothetical protein
MNVEIKLTSAGLKSRNYLDLLTNAASRGVAALPVRLMRGRVVWMMLQSSVARGSGAHHRQDRRAGHGHRFFERWSEGPLSQTMVEFKNVQIGIRKRKTRRPSGN